MFIKKKWYTLLIFLFIFPSVCFSEKEYTDEEIVQAIWLSEGGSMAQYPYGIRSIRYEDRTDKSLSRKEWARKICFNTVRNNRKRYADYGYKQFDTYLEFLQSRYCPTTGNLSKAEKELNGFWLKNVKSFLERSVK